MSGFFLFLIGDNIQIQMYKFSLICSRFMCFMFFVKNNAF